MASASARLSAPLGARTVTYGTQRLVPFDGSRLLAPDPLPAGTELRSDSGGSSDPDTAPVRTMSTWGRTFAATRPDDPAYVCAPGGPPTWTVLQEPAGQEVELAGDYADVGTRQVGTATAHLYAGTAFDTVRTFLVWQGAGGTVTVQAQETGCAGDRLPGEAELLAFARSLRTAS